ncbi:MAG: hypothetical protein D6772_07565 [Bacteroidetes bacterium]|nr:MAG: hypothetical protein D6772_07565 [Bacteroidota bacterium]
MLLLGLMTTASAYAYIGPGERNRTAAPANEVNFRMNCANAVSQIDQQVNNVRARLTTGGDVWWDGSDGRYVIPKPPPGVPEVSSIFAGAVWIGGFDPGGNLKVAAQTYGRNRGEFDFYPGPLNEGDPNYPGGQDRDPRRGTIGADTCAQWDQFFIVEGANIDRHVAMWEAAEAAGESSLDPDDIPDDVKYWPARGNRFFEEEYQFQLPDNDQGLAGFWDQNTNGLYEPDLGDYPIIEIRRCLAEEPKSAPDQMIYWVYNDAGNAHRQTGSQTAVQMEIQVQAFAYATNDDINNMTFQRYKLINRAIEDIDSTFFAMWIDPDLGCYDDDFIGCDTLRDLAYVYNADALDGINGTVCADGVNTYEDEVPILGIDYFQGPLNERREELGLSSFTYYNREDPNPGTTDPQTAIEFYNYISGSWRDGSPFTYGGDGYQDGEPTRYAFTEPPNDPNGWSMCTAGLPINGGDRRTLQASGPFKLEPGAINELIIGVVWVPDQNYPCPAITRLQRADDIAQDLFDACFNLTRGPDAPDVDWIELDRELVAVFSNDTLTSNNAFEAYAEQGLGFPLGVDDTFRFEGYKLYQFSGPDVSLADVDDPDKVRLVYQVDKKNGIAKIFNWETLSPADGQTPTAEEIFVPKLQVDGADEGIRHTFRITEDQFASGDRRLVNHRPYYFAAVAYAYNNYLEFDPTRTEDPGQQFPYLEGDRNIGDEGSGFYTVIPRKILDRQLQASYGEGPIITRIDGVGTGENFLDVSEETRNEIEDLIRADKSDEFSGEVTYRGGEGPIEVTIYNPLDVIDGEYELTFIDNNLSDDVVEENARWRLRSLTDASAPQIISERPISEVNEQVVREFGFSVLITQVEEPGTAPFEIEDNGAIGYEEEYLNPEANPWFFGVPDNTPIQTNNPLIDANLFNYVLTDASVDRDYELDPNRALTELGTGAFVPYYLANWTPNPLGAPYLTPAWKNNNNNFVRNSSATSLATLNNVDIVFTSDKSLWSRCVIVETKNSDYGQEYQAEGDRNQFDLRARPSVSKEDNDKDGLPDVDTNPLPGEEEGMGWFPGYAIDVETGQRLNIFFGENSVYNGTYEIDGEVFGPSNGGDMMFNPNDQFFFATPSTNFDIFNYPVGGQHYVYVTNTPYDRCAEIRERFGQPTRPTRKIAQLANIMWAGLVVLPPGVNMKSYDEGLIPEDLIVKLRVTNPYQVEVGTNEFNGYPSYRFKLESKQAQPLDEPAIAEALQQINVVPNPYYGFSEYENTQFDNIVKITNLPAVCTVTIYTLDGKFIRKYERNELGNIPDSPNRAIERDQINPDLRWDMKNFRQIPIASGVYLIHVEAPGLGERTLKWFGVNRQFDPSGL